MEYDVKEVSPVQREVEVKVPVEEVNAALTTTVALYRRGQEVKGFRKGKAPAQVIESKFKARIVGEATTDLINYQINEIMSALSLQPMSRIDVDADSLERDQEFTYKISFEVAPELDLPDYGNLKVDEVAVEVSDDDIAQVEQRILERAAEVKTLDDARPAKDGEIVTVSFAALKDGEVFDGIKAESFDLELGSEQALQEFEELVKTLAPGQEGEKEVTFPEDFINPSMAGQTLTMRAKVHAVKTKIIPELSDEVAKKAGFESVEKMRQGIRESYEQSRGQMHKSEAQKSLLDSMCDGLDFPLPPSMVEDRLDRMIADMESHLDRQGKSLSSLGKSLEELRNDQREEAEAACRSELVLLAVAKKENLDVTPEEIDQTLAKVAMQTRQPFQELKRYYEEHNLLVPLKDRILADKAMDLVYDKAQVTKVAPGDKKDAPEKAAPKKAAPKKAEAKKDEK